MDRLTSLRVFRDIVEIGSFSGAAKRLGLSAPMASKHVAELERSVGVRLLHRSSRRLSATESGEAYYVHCRQALEILDAADAEMRQGASSPRGPLKISAPVWCANPRFVAVLAEYHRRYPEVIVDLRLENRMVDLVADGFDLALRATTQPSPNLIARKICDVRFIAVAAPDYLAGRGADAVDALGVAEWIAPSYLNLNKMFPRRSAGSAGVPQTVMRTDDSNLIRLSVLAGIAPAVLPDWIVADDIAAGKMIEVPLGRTLQPIVLHAVYSSRRHVPLKLRTFVDFFSKSLSVEIGSAPAASVTRPTLPASSRGPVAGLPVGQRTPRLGRR